MSYPWKSFSFDPGKIVTEYALFNHVTYDLGAKAKSLKIEPSKLKTIDCSGFVRLIVYRLAGVIIPDGSWKQGEWFESKGFKVSDVAAGTRKDNVLRLAWLTPKDGGGTGHIAFIFNGMTYESCGGKGVHSRPWTGTGWQAKCTVFVLTKP